MRPLGSVCCPLARVFLFPATCGGRWGGAPSICNGNCAPPVDVSDVLTVADVQRVIAQAVGEASALQRPPSRWSIAWATCSQSFA